MDVWVARVVESYVRTESEGSSEDAGVRRREVRWYDAPDAGGPGGGGAGSGVTSRRVERMGVEGGDAVGVVEGLGYKCVRLLSCTSVPLWENGGLGD